MLTQKNVHNTGLGAVTPPQSPLAMKDTEVWEVSKNTRVKTAGPKQLSALHPYCGTRSFQIKNKPRFRERFYSEEVLR